LKLSIVFVLFATLLYSNFGAVLATTGSADLQGSGMSGEEFAELFARYASQGNETEYERIIGELTGTTTGVQVVITYDTDPSNSGEVWQYTTPSGKVSAGTQTNRGVVGWITSVVASPPMYDIYGSLIGIVYNEANLIGTADSKYALLETTGWSPHPLFPNDVSKRIAGEAITNGALGNFYYNAVINTRAYTNKPT
jgi:hypothetical protein